MLNEQERQDLFPSRLIDRLVIIEEELPIAKEKILNVKSLICDYVEDDQSERNKITGELKDLIDIFDYCVTLITGRPRP